MKPHEPLAVSQALDEVLSLNRRWMPSAKLIWGIFFCVLTKATRLVLVSIADDRSPGCSVCPGVRPPAADSKRVCPGLRTSHCWSLCALNVLIASFNIAIKELKNNRDEITVPLTEMFEHALHWRHFRLHETGRDSLKTLLNDVFLNVVLRKLPSCKLPWHLSNIHFFMVYVQYL